MEDNNDYIITQIVKVFLGEPRVDYDPLSKKSWIEFNCPSPKCKHDSDKYNLTYNTKSYVFSCWKCGYKSFIYNCAIDYGSAADLNRIKSILPQDRVDSLRNQSVNKPKVDHHLITCKLPEGYFPLGRNRNTPLYKLAWDYLVHERKVSPSFIDKYEIGYTETGPRRFRIIIPSKNALGRINYYEARSYVKGPKVIPYIKPPGDEVHKNDIIFNEYFINWDLPVFLVEGPFDMLRFPNAIPVLGKEISELLTNELVKHNSTVIICFDPDAIDKTVETYTKLSSLGLNVFFIDLVSYNKDFVENNFPKIKGKEREEMLNRDISRIYEGYGRIEVVNAIKYIKRLDLTTQISKKLRNE